MVHRCKYGTKAFVGISISTISRYRAAQIVQFWSIHFLLDYVVLFCFSYLSGDFLLLVLVKKICFLLTYQTESRRQKVRHRQTSFKFINYFKHCPVYNWIGLSEHYLSGDSGISTRNSCYNYIYRKLESFRNGFIRHHRVVYKLYGAMARYLIWKIEEKTVLNYPNEIS